jgi:hypothetical protein
LAVLGLSLSLSLSLSLATRRLVSFRRTLCCNDAAVDSIDACSKTFSPPWVYRSCFLPLADEAQLSWGYRFEAAAAYSTSTSFGARPLKAASGKSITDTVQKVGKIKAWHLAAGFIACPPFGW